MRDERDPKRRRKVKASWRGTVSRRCQGRANICCVNFTRGGGVNLKSNYSKVEYKQREDAAARFSREKERERERGLALLCASFNCSPGPCGGTRVFGSSALPPISPVSFPRSLSLSLSLFPCASRISLANLHIFQPAGKLWSDALC